jgi:hypothetical protein
MMRTNQRVTQRVFGKFYENPRVQYGPPFAAPSQASTAHHIDADRQRPGVLNSPPSLVGGIPRNGRPCEP